MCLLVICSPSTGAAGSFRVWFSPELFSIGRFLKYMNDQNLPNNPACHSCKSHPHLCLDALMVTCAISNSKPFVWKLSDWQVCIHLTPSLDQTGNSLFEKKKKKMLRETPPKLHARTHARTHTHTVHWPDSHADRFLSAVLSVARCQTWCQACFVNEESSVGYAPDWIWPGISFPPSPLLTSAVCNESADWSLMSLWESPQ